MYKKNKISFRVNKNLTLLFILFFYHKNGVYKTYKS